MGTSSAVHHIERDHLAESFHKATEKLDGLDGEMILDFTAVKRIDPDVLKNLRELLLVADVRKTKLTLRGVDVDVYKVLKLMKLSSQFSYVD